MIISTLEPLRQFRQAVYQTLSPSRDAAFEIMDAIAASPTARSAVEVSLAPTLLRNFCSLYKGIERTRIDLAQLRPWLVREAERAGHLLIDGWAVYALDHTPYPRPTAPTVRDRSYVHGAQGVEIGHQYSLLGRVMHDTGSGVGVVDCTRIQTHHTPTEVGAQQITRLKAQARVPRIISADSEYVTDQILDTADHQTRLLIRFKGNRKLDGAPQRKRAGERGRRPQQGAKLKLNQVETLRPPEQSLCVAEADGGWTVISVWENVHVESRPHLSLCAVRVEVFAAHGQRRYKRPLWLAWSGEASMNWASFWRIYLRRFCLECVHQFTKNSLAWTRGRFSSTGREERWSWLVLLAYWQLLLAAPLAREVCRPWEKPTRSGTLLTPGRVQRDYLRIFWLVGSPTRPPKERGMAAGRAKGYHPLPRPRYRVVYKGKEEAVEA